MIVHGVKISDKTIAEAKAIAIKGGKLTHGSLTDAFTELGVKKSVKYCSNIPHSAAGQVIGIMKRKGEIKLVHHWRIL